MTNDTALDFGPTADDDVAAPQGTACASCGSPVEAGDKFCNACGTAQAPPAGPACDPSAAPATDDKRHFRCNNCSAEVSVDPDQRSYVCAFCDSTYVIELPASETNRLPPEFVIGFTVAPEQAVEKFRAWLADGGLFRPGDLRNAEIADRLRGVYIPFWSFSMLASSGWRASIGEYWYRTETYTTTVNGKLVTRTRQVRETEWWDLAGRHHRYYSGYLVSGSKGLPQGTAERVKPFHTAALKRYEPYFLAGWLCEEYTVEREAALAMCQAEFGRQERNNVAAFLPGDTNRGLAADTRFSEINSDLVLLPLYMLNYRYQGKLYRFLINGQTGKAVGERPWSRLRIALAVGAGLLLAAVVVLVILWLRR